jgi:hypothetical protein
MNIPSRIALAVAAMIAIPFPVGRFGAVQAQ